MKRFAKQRYRNLAISYLVGCLLAVIIVVGTTHDSFDSNDFWFGFYLFLFCHTLIWEPLSICTILLIYKTKVLPTILDNLWQCVFYAFLPSLLMFSDAFCGNVWIRHFQNVDSVFLLVVVYLTYYVAAFFIAVFHRIVVNAASHCKKRRGHEDGSSDHFSNKKECE